MFFLPVFLDSGKAGAEEAVLFGHITDTRRAPLGGVKIIIASKQQHLLQSHETLADGFFRAAGLPPGEYSLLLEAKGYITRLHEKIVFEPARILYLRMALIPVSEAGVIPPEPSFIDLSGVAVETVIGEKQVEALPSGNTIWSLIENQDLSATTNRIDVGGLWSGTPGLFSARGGCSWTQNAYHLNGMDVTDPYWTGTPLFYPDIFSLRYIQHRNAGHSPEHLSPGGYLNLIPKEGGPEWHGSFSAYLTDSRLVSSNITPALQKEGLRENNSFGHYRNLNARLSGPLIPGRLFFFASMSGLDLSRDIAEFEPEDKARLYSGLVNLKYVSSWSSLNFLWTGQVVNHSSFGAGRRIPFSSTLDQTNLYNVLQLSWNVRRGDRHFFRTGFSFSASGTRSDLQKKAAGPHRTDVFRGILDGPAPSAGRDDRSLLVFSAKGQSLFGNLSPVLHQAEYGFTFRRGFSSTETTIARNLHLRFFEGKPLEVVRFQPPAKHEETSSQFSLFTHNTFTFSNLFSLTLGLNFSSDRGWVPASGSSPKDAGKPASVSGGKNEIWWVNLSPRVGLILPLSKKKTSSIRVFGGRYFFNLPLNYLTWGNTNALGGLAYAWQDKNKDSMFQDDEAGALLRREGPYFARIDSGLKRPYTDEFSVALVHSLSKSLFFFLAGFYRESRNLIETINTGVPFSAYTPVQVYDIGDDRIPGNHDDLYLTVYNQKKETLGQDFFLLTNQDAGTRVTRYRGLDLAVVKKYSPDSVLFFSFTATEAVGTTSPGNTEWENDDAIVGSLYDTPNTLIFSRGRVRFDRAYTARIGFSLSLPLGFKLGSVIKYYDGQPFTRKIIITGFNQGPFYIQAFPRGIARYEFNMTADVRLEKTLVVGKGRIRLLLDGFNIFNQKLATQENEWTGPEFPLRFATEIQPARVVRLGLAYEF